MPSDDKTILAQQLARTFNQIKRLALQYSSTQEIRHSEFLLLATLMNSIIPGSKGMKISDLSTQLQITPAAATHIINSLEEIGYIERLPEPGDRRVVLVRPTEKAIDVAKARELKFIKYFEGLVSYIGEQDGKELERLLALTLNYFKERKNSNED